MRCFARSFSVALGSSVLVAGLGLGLVACHDSRGPTAPEAEAAAAPTGLEAARELAEGPPGLPEADPPLPGALDVGEPGEDLDAAGLGQDFVAAGGHNQAFVCHFQRGRGEHKLLSVGTQAAAAHLAQHPLDIEPIVFYPDLDGDGFGSDASGDPVLACAAPDGFVDNNDDCDDAASSCTTDCVADLDGDGRADCVDRCLDADGDGYGDDNSGATVGAGPDAVGQCTTNGTTPCDLGAPCLGDDCDDADADVNPGADELCNGIDDNCDGDVDEGFDLDGDTYTSCGGDCDDSNPAINPDADDSLCDGVDDDCDGGIDDDYVSTPTVCGVGECAAGGDLVCVAGSEQDTCTPGAPVDEICDDGLDNDCDGEVDDDDVCGDSPPVARNDWINGCSLSPSGANFTCTFNAPAGTLFANNPGTTASGPSGADFDPDGDSFVSLIAGMNVVGATGDPWSPPGPQPRTCTAQFLCTTDSNFVPGSSSLTVNGDGSFNLTYTTSVEPFGSLIAEFLYVLQESTPAMLQSDPALVEVIISP